MVVGLSHVNEKWNRKHNPDKFVKFRKLNEIMTSLKKHSFLIARNYFTDSGKVPITVALTADDPRSIG